MGGVLSAQFPAFLSHQGAATANVADATPNVAASTLPYQYPSPAKPHPSAICAAPKATKPVSATCLNVNRRIQPYSRPVPAMRRHPAGVDGPQPGRYPPAMPPKAKPPPSRRKPKPSDKPDPTKAGTRSSRAETQGNFAERVVLDATVDVDLDDELLDLANEMAADTNHGPAGTSRPNPAEQPQVSHAPEPQPVPKGKAQPIKAKRPPTPRPPKLRDLLQPEPDPETGARLLKKQKVAWLERVMDSPVVAATTKMTAFGLHCRLTGDLIDEEPGAADDKPPQRIEPAEFLQLLSGFAGQEPQRFLKELGGIKHILSILIEIARIHPAEIAEAALSLVDAEGNVHLVRLPAVEERDLPPSMDS